MYLYSVIIAFLFLTNVSICAPIIEDDQTVQLLDSFQSRKEDMFEFKYKLSDGQMREERIMYNDLDNGIAIKGSYNIELEDGEMQTIYYISDIRGHRISINVPFTDDGEIVRRAAPTRKLQNHVEARKKYTSESESLKSYNDNKIEENQRKGRVQENPKDEVKEEQKTDSVGPKIENARKMEKKIEEKILKEVDKISKTIEKVEEEVKIETKKADEVKKEIVGDVKTAEAKDEASEIDKKLKSKKIDEVKSDNAEEIKSEKIVDVEGMNSEEKKQEIVDTEKIDEGKKDKDEKNDEQ